MITRIDTKRRAFPALALPALAFAAALFLVGQPASSQEDVPSLFGEVIDIRVVNIEAVVTDRRGNRVTDLGPDDFRLLVDGVEQPIAYFTAVEAGRAVAGEIRGGDGEAEALPAVTAGEPVGNSYLVFIDDYYSIGAQRNLVLDNLARQVPALRAQDRMAIVAFDGRELTMLSSWTSSTATLSRIFEQAKERRAFGLHRRAENFNGFEREIQRSSPAFATSERRLQLERTTSAVVATLRSFARPPGRKVMLLLNGGWPTGPFYEPGDGTLGARKTDLTITSAIADTANLLGYTVYPIDIPGFVVQAANVDQIRPRNVAVRNAGLGRAPGLGFDGGRFAGEGSESFRVSSLRMLARQTGGRPLLFGDRLKVLPKVSEDTTAYYWLGFNVDRRYDDRQHRIRVEVLRPGLKVRARRNFLDLSPRSEVSMMAQSALLFGTADQRLEVEVGLPTLSGWRRMSVPLRIAIPADEITVVPTAGGFAAEVELRLAAADSSGAQSEMLVVPVRLTGDTPPRPGTTLYYDASIQLRRRPHEVVVSVHDTPSNHVMTRVVGVVP